MQHPEIRQKIIESLNLSGLTKPEQDKIVFMIMDNISSRISIAIWDTLSGQDKEDLNNIEKKEFLDYISVKIKDFPKLVEDITRQTLYDFKGKRVGIS